MGLPQSRRCSVHCAQLVCLLLQPSASSKKPMGAHVKASSRVRREGCRAPNKVYELRRTGSHYPATAHEAGEPVNDRNLNREHIL